MKTSSQLGDVRLDARYDIIVEQLCNNVGGSIPTSGVVRGQTKAIYRFVANPRITPTKLQLLEQDRLYQNWDSQRPRILYHLQDTTDLNYSKHWQGYQFGCLSDIKQKGMYLHTSLLLDETRSVTGVLAQDFLDRSEWTIGSSRKLAGLQSKLPVEVKESYRWVDHFEQFQTLIAPMTETIGYSICDAEGDFYELLAARQSENTHLIVRTQHDHRLKEGRLLNYLNTQTSLGSAWLEVTLEDKHTKRPVELEIRCCRVTVLLPENLAAPTICPQTALKRRETMPFLTLYAVQAQEINVPEGCEAISWTLLTTVPVQDYWDALDILQKYTYRWQIEIFYLVLKEGCKVEELKLQTPQKIQNAVVLYSLVAARVVRLRSLTEKAPQLPIEITGFTKQDYAILVLFAQLHYKARIAPVPEPTVQDGIAIIALMGGGNPKKVGIRQLWKGLTKVDIILKTAKALQNSG